MPCASYRQQVKAAFGRPFYVLDFPDGSDNAFDDHDRSVWHANVNSNEFKRWLAKPGATFVQGNGSHLKVFLKDRQSVLPMHATELKTDTVEGIKKRLGLKRR